MALNPFRRSSFAKLFPAIVYDPNTSNNPSLDIWSTFFAHSDPIGNDEELYQKYRLSSGDTLESIALKLYSDVYLWWTIPLANNVEDPFDFLENVHQGDGFENGEIKVFKPSLLSQITSEIQRNVRRNNVNFERQYRK